MVMTKSNMMMRKTTSMRMRVSSIQYSDHYVLTCSDYNGNKGRSRGKQGRCERPKKQSNDEQSDEDTGKFYTIQ